MCGIVGLWNLDKERIDVRRFDIFVDTLKHRGPDGRGTYLSDCSSLALGHRLLAIQGEPGEGAQPRGLGGRYYITFNGEIFNYVDLREELRVLGHQISSTTDTEVVLAAYAEWGEKCLLKFNGMWSFAIWDKYERKLFIAVDRMAVKSCLYISTPFLFAFASEIKAFAELQRFDLTPDGNEVSAILSMGTNANDKTWAKNVFRIPAGHTLTVHENKSPKLVRWWNTLDHLVEVPRSRLEQSEKFNELFLSSVTLRTSGHGKIAIPLSGGMDSSSVMAVASAAAVQRNQSPYDCFFVKKHGLLDEEPFAKIMAASHGAPLHIVQSSKTLAISVLESTTISYEKFLPGSEGPSLLYQAVGKSGAKVTLDGHGGDEILGGYSTYINRALFDAFKGVPNPKRIVELAIIDRGLNARSEDFSFHEGWKHTQKRLREALRIRIGKNVIRRNPAQQTLLDPDDSLEDKFPPWYDELNKELYRDTHYGFLQRILRTFDYASMSFGIEARTPFLDWRLVCFMFSLPSTTKIGHGFTKYILRDAMRNQIPNQVLWRRSKVGFIDSLSYFFNPEIVRWMGDQISSQSFQESPYWNGKQIVSVYDRWILSGCKQGNIGKKLLSVSQAHFLFNSMCKSSARNLASSKNFASTP